MASMLQNLRLLADPSRIRILLLVSREETIRGRTAEHSEHGPEPHLHPFGAA